MLGPGSLCHPALATATDSATIRPVMKKLIAAGKVTTEGQKRGMTYSAT